MGLVIDSLVTKSLWDHIIQCMCPSTPIINWIICELVLLGYITTFHVFSQYSGGYLFALGGGSKSGEANSDVQRYDPLSNSWTLMAPMPFACFLPMVVSYAGKLYVTGGCDINEVNIMKHYSSVDALIIYIYPTENYYILIEN